MTHRLIHTSGFMREAASRFMCSRKGHIVNVFQKWVYKRPTRKGRQNGANGVLTCNQHNVGVTAGLQVFMQRGSPGIFKQRYSLRSIRQGVAFERRVMTHSHLHASRHRRETDSHHMHPRRGHTLKHFSTLGIQTAHLQADNVQQRYCATGTLINICVIRQVLSCTSRLLSVL